jgi:hypothetical protein
MSLTSWGVKDSNNDEAWQEFMEIWWADVSRGKPCTSDRGHVLSVITIVSLPVKIRKIMLQRTLALVVMSKTKDKKASEVFRGIIKGIGQ